MAPGDQRRTVSRLRVTASDGRGRSLGLALPRWLTRVAPASARGVVSVAVVSDTVVRRLNRTYRRKDRPTDVLSFPATDDGRQPGEASRPRRAGTLPHLGDIVIARGVARRQAKARGHAEVIELKVLALHGLLHLLGYDHERDNGRMRRVEQRLRRRGGLPPGLIERSRTPRA